MSESHCDCHVEVKESGERGTLVALLLINAVMFVVEGSLGWLGQSTALLADGLDMFADASVYALSLYAIGRSAVHKGRAALTSGYLQLGLGLLVLFDVARRALVGSEPHSWFMIGIGAVALVANVVCLRLITSYRDGEVHMRASYIFSKNDVIANAGVIVGGVIVLFTGLVWVDLLLGGLIAAVVLRGGWLIVQDARGDLAGARESDGDSAGNACAS